VLARRFDLSGALKEFSAAVELEPSSGPARCNRGRVLYDLGRLKEAQTELALASQLAPNDSNALYLLTLAQARSGDLARSAESLERLIQRNPRQADAQKLLAQLLLRMDRTSGAISRWRMAIDVNPEDLRALHELTDLLRKARSPDASRYSGCLSALEGEGAAPDRSSLGIRLFRFGRGAPKIGRTPRRRSGKPWSCARDAPKPPASAGI